MSNARRQATSRPQFRVKVDALGYGFVIPAFFVASGVRLDLDLADSPSALARVPLFVLALLLLARGLPARLDRRWLGTDAGLLAVVVFPPIAIARLRNSTPAEAGAMQRALPLLAHRPMGTQD